MFARRVTRGTRSVLYAVSAALVGIVLGLGFFTAVYAKGASYLTDDPNACANCHVMQEQLDSWVKSSHGKVAVCNDCHTPSGLVPKYLVKAQNGWSHSFAFTSQNFPDEIVITERSRRVTESACLKCHEDVVDGIQGVRAHDEKVSCITCHRTVGHM
jgi:cytochrome c nitrite reductase small subunit